MTDRPGAKTAVRVWELHGDAARSRPDHLATEEPLEIRVIAGGVRQTAAVTMRTPGHDFELAAGFLHGEGVIAHAEDIARITYCVDPDVDAAQQYNIVNVALRRGVTPDLAPLERHFTMTSACGVCGKASLEALQLRGLPPVVSALSVPAEVLYTLPGTLARAQRVFQQTGGLHAAALFDTTGQLIALREDVGRHNALDKLIGWALLNGYLPLGERILLVSGRTSYEILQKSLAAGIPIVCAISAPSSLAVDLARQFGITLAGFLRDDRCNIYSGRQRVTVGAATAAG
ncbi:MAG: formate dehydrogenase accessory sulfurtransferase FdhD [Thermomicrobiales bacterium]